MKQIKIMFVCHGNICRSPMAEFILKDMVKTAGLSHDFYIASSATSREEIGSPPHRGTINKLRQEGIPIGERSAIQLTRSDYDKYDYIIAMDSNNLRNIKYIIPQDPDNKIHRLLDFADCVRKDIADPWYTDNFDATYDDITIGCKAFLERINK